ncbi:LysR family transcriptional regulator [Lacimicrobium alkaliphilum]|uniref:HTH lysR-type domain-containing protein n=1 Tax=Lacimicrobium alkaliphilum TaxID=1526571 RepID=A0A0U2PJW3_9ALTE|nr:LysR family transcriptional regulator [Lacimicrobium alkaliphilum]ALS99853.1 hypothetical protein AT746_17340 [Lacimicrobium alkaliphilum]
MKLEQLRVFKAVAEYGSVRNASVRLYKSAPSVSAAIKSLEDSIGIQLFSRDGYRLSLTGEGTTFLAEAKKLLESADALKRFPAKIPGETKMEYEIVYDASLSRFQILKLADFLDFNFPQLALTFTTLHPQSDMYDLFSKSIWDLAILPLSKVISNRQALPNELVMRTFSKERFYAMCSSAYQGVLKSEKENKLDFENETQIVFEENSYDPEGDDEKPILSRKTISVNDMETKLNLIVKGKGWGFLPADLVSNDVSKNTLLRLESGELKSYAINYYLIMNQNGNSCDASRKIWKSKL